MLKACLKLFITGIIMFFVGIIGIGVLIGTDLIDIDDLSISLSRLGSTNSYAYESTIDSGYDGYNYLTIDSSDVNITSLDIDIGLGSFILCHGDEFGISTEGIKNDQFSYELRDGCLYVKYSSEFNLLSFDFTALNDDAEIILTVPEKDFDSVNLNMTAGDISVMDINTKKLTAKSSAGSMWLDNIYAESASFKMTAGNCTVSNSTIKNAALSMTAGDMFFNDCKLYGDNNIKMTAGELQMCLVGNREDYRINIDKALGNVYINGADMGEYAETTFATTVPLTETTVTGEAVGVLSHGDGSAAQEIVIVDEKITDKKSDNEKPNGSIDINMTAGDCYIEFLGGTDYE